MTFDSLQELTEYIKRDRYSITDNEWKESQHPRGQPGNAGQFAKTDKTLASNIETVLHGTEKEKSKLRNRFFDMGTTPQDYKDVGLKGDNFSIRYGVINKHKGKNSAHNFSADEWRQICKNLSNPDKCIITKYNDNTFNIYTRIGKSVLIGTQVKNFGKDKNVNGIQTVFRDVPNEREPIIYPKDLKKITTAQQSLLNEINHHSYIADGRYFF